MPEEARQDVIADLIHENKAPPWLLRALNPLTPITPGNESIRTASGEVEGRELLFPTIRMIDGELKRFTPQEALQEALKRGDFIAVEGKTRQERIDKANALAKAISDALGKRGLGQDRPRSDPDR